jgi:hypothetical protein
MIGEVSLYGLYFPPLLLAHAGGAGGLAAAQPGPGTDRFLPPGVAPGAVRFFPVRHRAGRLDYFIATGPEMAMKISFRRSAGWASPARRRRRHLCGLAAVAPLRGRALDPRRPRESLCGAGRAGRHRPGDQGLRARQPARGKAGDRCSRSTARASSWRCARAKRQVAAAQAALSQAAARSKRNTQLDDLVSQETREQGQTRVDQARAALAQAVVNRDTAKLNLERTHVVSVVAASSPTSTCAKAPTRPPRTR